MNYKKEKKTILTQIDELIDKRKTELFAMHPHIHEVNDGFIIRFFSDWDNCIFENKIKYKIITNKNDSNELIIFYFIPYNVEINIDCNKNINEIICLSGKLEIKTINNTYQIENFSKLDINDKILKIKALKDSYVITVNDNEIILLNNND